MTWTRWRSGRRLTRRRRGPNDGRRGDSVDPTVVSVEVVEEQAHEWQ
jgi:hypothetical protein